MAGNLGLVEQSIKSMRTVKDYINVGMETSLDCVDDFDGCTKGCDKEIKDIKNIMLDYVKMERDLQQFLEAVEEVKQHASGTNENTDLLSLLDQTLSHIQQTQKTPPLQEHVKYRDLMDKIHIMQNPDEEPPSTSTQQMMVDEDIAMTQSEQSTRCPYTGKDMVVPVRNKICSHCYDKDGITHYMKTKRSKAKCPVAGCGNTAPIQASDLVEDRDLKRLIDRKNKQAARKARQREEVLS